MKERAAGLGFLVVLVALLGVCVGSYLKMFTPSVDVNVQAPAAGMQMQRGADVKLNGVLVGEVRSVASSGKGANLAVALEPESRDKIPSGTTARLLPKTLFGEKFVDLIVPKKGGHDPIPAGSTINVDKSKQATELSDVLDAALPLLRAVPPEKLALTLTSLSDALEGRGDELGDTFVKLGDIARSLNKEMPSISADIDKLAKVLDNYRGALPDLMGVLDNLAVTNNTISEKSEDMEDLFIATHDFSAETQDFLDRYEGRLVQFGEVTAPFADVLGTYAPEYPCLFEGLNVMEDRLSDAFSGGKLHITLEITKNNGKYKKGKDEPEWATSTGPECHGLPDPDVPAPEREYNNGYDHDESRTDLPVEIPGLTDAADAGSGKQDEDGDAEGSGGGDSGGSGGDGELPFNPNIGYAGTEEEEQVLTPLVAGATGQEAEETNEDLVSLLWGPILRGATVSVK